MSSFNENEIARSADGKFAPTSTSETDASAIESEGFGPDDFVADAFEHGVDSVDVPGVGRVRVDGTPEYPTVIASDSYHMPTQFVSEDSMHAYIATMTDGAELAPPKSPASQWRRVDYTAHLEANDTFADAGRKIQNSGYDTLRSMSDGNNTMYGDVIAFHRGREAAREHFETARSDGDPTSVALLNEYTYHYGQNRDSASPSEFLAGRTGRDGDAQHPSYRAGEAIREHEAAMRAQRPPL